MGNVVWLSMKDGTPARGYWDQTLLEEIFKDSHHVYEISHGMLGAVVIIPGAYQAPYTNEINKELAKLKWCVVIITSDEENLFPIDKLKHPKIKILANYATAKFKKVDQWLPIGAARKVKNVFSDKPLNWSFAGQVTHEARQSYVEKLKERSDGYMMLTEGFAQGLSTDKYHLLLSESKTVPSPRGYISPDSFRLYEAIEAGAVPIPQSPEFWEMLFENIPFPIITQYDQLNGYINDALDLYPIINNEVQAWWLQQKRKIKLLIENYITELGGTPDVVNMVTVIIPVSPIKSHPDTRILDETISTIRKHLPSAEIIVTFDGVRKENEKLRNNYDEFKRKFLWKCYNEYENILPIFFKNHTHQVGMAREIINYIKTPLILYCEQDTPITPDVEIEWGNIINDLLLGHSNMIRFHFEAHIPKEHLHMVHGMDARTSAPLMMTSQWSQRPHLTTVAFYRRILRDHFTPQAVSFIEDNMHGIVHEAYLNDGMLGWEQFKIHIYCPEGNIKRSYHTDGREGEPKYDDKQVF